MDSVARLDDSERADLFRETAAARSMPASIVEKDFWVCWVLKYLFERSRLAGHIIFKGGTSLAKITGVIHRFSEDVDLILDWGLLSISTDEPWQQRSKTRQDAYNKSVNEKARTYIRTEFTPMLERDLAATGIAGLTAAVDEDDPFVVCVRYPRSFEHPYIQPVVRLEAGPLAAWVPHATYTIRPYAAEHMPKRFVDSACRVVATTPERVFWEKATILHQEAHRPQAKGLPSRHSRHYYDMVMMAQSSVRTSALAQSHLLAEVAAFKARFYPCAWARYEDATTQLLRLAPPEPMQARLAADYRQMREMILSEPPSLEQMLAALRELERDIHALPTQK
jgi:hypothetical protein